MQIASIMMVQLKNFTNNSAHENFYWHHQHKKVEKQVEETDAATIF